MAPACIKHTEHHDNNNHKVNVPSLRRALVNRNYAKLWYGQAVSAVGDMVFGTPDATLNPQAWAEWFPAMLNKNLGVGQFKGESIAHADARKGPIDRLLEGVW